MYLKRNNSMPGASRAISPHRVPEKREKLADYKQMLQHAASSKAQEQNRLVTNNSALRTNKIKDYLDG